MALLAGVRPLVAALSLVVLLAAAPAAHAARAEAVEVPSPFGQPNESVTFSEVRYAGDGGESNDVLVSMDGPTVQLADGGAEIAAGANCAAIAPQAVECAVPTCAFEPCLRVGYLVAVVINLGSGDDILFPSRPQGCNTGNCLYSSAALRVSGGRGNDTINGGSGGPDFSDELDGGPGNDVIVQGAGGMTATCGPGLDTVVLSGGGADVAADCEIVTP